MRSHRSRYWVGMMTPILYSFTSCFTEDVEDLSLSEQLVATIAIRHIIRDINILSVLILHLLLFCFVDVFVISLGEHIFLIIVIVEICRGIGIDGYINVF